MTEEQRKRIHDIEYSCDSRAELGERIVALEDENAELKKAMDFQALELGCMTDNRDVLHVENAKLRELAKAAWGCVKRQVSCDDCRVVCCGCTLQSAMRELGIEAD